MKLAMLGLATVLTASLAGCMSTGYSDGERPVPHGPGSRDSYAAETAPAAGPAAQTPDDPFYWLDQQ